MAYFYDYYIAQNMGPGYVATNITYVIAAVLLLNGVERTRRGVLRAYAGLGEPRARSF